MSIENRGENKWRFRVRKDGINYSQTFYGTETEAEREHKKFEVDVMRGQIGYNENMKFSELAQLVLDEYMRPTLKANTIRIYISVVNNHLLSEFGTMKLSKIKPLNIQKMINDRAKTLKPNSVKGIYRELNKIFNKAIEWEIISKNPCNKTKLPKVEKTNYRELLSSENITKLINAIEEQPIMYKTIYSIALFSGMRQGEIIGLHIPDIKENSINVDKQFGYVMVNDKLKKDTTSTKTDNSERTAYIPDFLSMLIKEYISGMKIKSTEQILFYNPKTKKNYDRKAIAERFDKMLSDYGIPDIRFHDLRHLYATLSINAGISVVSVAKNMGDTIETVLKNYTHNIDEEQQKAVQEFEKYIKSKHNLPDICPIEINQSF